MEFRIGTRRYLVKRRWKLTCDGEPADGLCDFTSRTIWLDADLRPDVIVGVLRHEHVHAWEAEVGRTQSDEDRANFISTVSEAFEYEFDAQGGLAALMELPIGGNRGAAPKPQPVRPMGMSDRIECSHCGAAIMSGSVFTGDPRIVESVAMTVVDRGCQCPVCDSVQVWEERATAEGVPLGEYYNPKLLTGAEAGEWCRGHPMRCEYNAA